MPTATGRKSVASTIPAAASGKLIPEISIGDKNRDRTQCLTLARLLRGHILLLWARIVERKKLQELSVQRVVRTNPEFHPVPIRATDDHRIYEINNRKQSFFKTSRTATSLAQQAVGDLAMIIGNEEQVDREPKTQKNG